MAHKEYTGRFEPPKWRMKMTFNFYSYGETLPCLTFVATGVDLYDQMCESIVDHVLGADPYSETLARDLVKIVAMQTPDESEYVEAVFVQGKLVGSMDAPFELDASEYVEI
jgi:hypothetical protein